MLNWLGIFFLLVLITIQPWILAAAVVAGVLIWFYARSRDAQALERYRPTPVEPIRVSLHPGTRLPEIVSSLPAASQADARSPELFTSQEGQSEPPWRRTLDGRFPLLNEDWVNEVVLSIDDPEIPETFAAT